MRLSPIFRRPLAAVSLLAPCAVLCIPLHAEPPASGVATPPPVPARSFYTTPFARRPTAAAMTALGRTLFFDPALSASGTMACSTCHDPAFAFGPPNDLAVQRGGTDGRQPGIRAVPSLRYLQNVPRFTEHYQEDDGNDAEDQGPAGGRTWDGREDTAHDQARVPLLSPFEMANASLDAVVGKVRAAPYAAQFRDAFGANVLDEPQLAQAAILLSLEVFQQSPAEFYPYDSKYDAYLRQQAALSEAEQRGLRLFNDANKGNCASCHVSTIREGALPSFTDFGFLAIGVPRNAAIPANADATWHDLGLCGPLRKDLADRPGYCGLFRTPTLRNTALRKSYFHNGAFHDLRKVVEFYAGRDVSPEQWYPHDADGGVRKFDDLPEAYRGNVDTDPPFGGAVGGKPALSESEIDDIVAFLQALTDGYRPAVGDAGR